MYQTKALNWKKISDWPLLEHWDICFFHWRFRFFKVDFGCFNMVTKIYSLHYELIPFHFFSHEFPKNVKLDIFRATASWSENNILKRSLTFSCISCTVTRERHRSILGFQNGKNWENYDIQLRCPASGKSRNLCESHWHVSWEEGTDVTDHRENRNISSDRIEAPTCHNVSQSRSSWPRLQTEALTPCSALWR